MRAAIFRMHPLESFPPAVSKTCKIWSFQFITDSALHHRLFIVKFNWKETKETVSCRGPVSRLWIGGCVDMVGMIIDIMKFLLLVYIALELRDISAKLSNKWDVLSIQPKQTRQLWQSRSLLQLKTCTLLSAILWCTVLLLLFYILSVRAFKKKSNH